jgi:hypothetical protein
MRVFKHSGALGDIIYSLPTIEALGGGELWMNKYDQNVNGASLFALQPCIKAVLDKGPSGEEVVDLDVYRHLERDMRLAGDVRHLADYFAIAFNVEPDLARPWLSAGKKRVASVVVHRSTHYHDKEGVDWSLLKGRDCVFVGFQYEWNVFDKMYKLGIPYYECEDLLEMACIINGCDLFVGNQSSGFAIAEALKVNRVLEVFHLNPNCMPKSSNGRTKLIRGFMEECCGCA